MSTPPTGEDPQRRWAPDDSPTAPQQPPGSGAPDRAVTWAAPGTPSPYGKPGGYAQPAWQPGPAGEQPGYGPPGAQTPAPWQPDHAPEPPRDRTRTALIAALVLVALAIAGGIALLVYVLSSTILKPEAVERDVAVLFEEREGVSVDLDCSRRMIVRPGADYECEGVTADGEEVEIRITITGEDGAYTWAEK